MNHCNLALSLVLAATLTSAPAQDEPPSTTPPEPTSIVGTTNSMEVLDSNRILNLGDLLSYRVVEDKSNRISRLIINDAGEVEVPLIGRVKAKGKTCKSLAVEIKRVLELNYYNKATVIISLDFVGRRGPGGSAAALSAGQIIITGSVGRAGKLQIPNREMPYTLSEAILDAGGFDRFAKSSKVQVVRTGKNGVRKTYYVNMDDVMKKGKLDKDLVLQPNDFIIVKDKFLNF